MRAYRRGVADYAAALLGHDRYGKRVVDAEADAAAKLIAAYVYPGSSGGVRAVEAGAYFVDPRARLDVGDLARQIAWYKTQGLVGKDVDARQTVDLSFTAGPLFFEANLWVPAFAAGRWSLPKCALASHRHCCDDAVTRAGIPGPTSRPAREVFHGTKWLGTQGSPVHCAGGPFQSGKTTLLEAILARTGAVQRQGTVDAGSTVGDASKEARAHKMSIEATFASTSFMGDDYVFVDCPGSIEFIHDMRSVLPAVDAAVVVCEADEKKVPQLQLILRELEDQNIPHFL